MALMLTANRSLISTVVAVTILVHGSCKLLVIYTKIDNRVSAAIFGKELQKHICSSVLQKARSTSTLSSLTNGLHTSSKHNMILLVMAVVKLIFRMIKGTGTTWPSVSRRLSICMLEVLSPQASCELSAELCEAKVWNLNFERLWP